MIPSLSRQYRPRVFVGSSTEGRQYADAVFSEIEEFSEPTVWDQDLFTPTQPTITELQRFCHEFEIAIFVFTPDDIRISRGRESAAPRDNLIFELGLFAGLLGLQRLFVIIPIDCQLALPTDLSGITYLKYHPRQDGNHRAAVRTACNEARRVIQDLGASAPVRTTATSYWHSIPERHRDQCDARSLISRTASRVFISGITLSYVVQHCKSELIAALLRGVQIEIVIVENSALAKQWYKRYSPVLDENLPLAHKRYTIFSQELPPEAAHRFAVFLTDLPLTHSLGLYDDVLYVSEFCIDTESSRVPSYSVAPRTPSHEVYLAEIRTLLREARPFAGNPASGILAAL